MQQRETKQITQVQWEAFYCGLVGLLATVHNRKKRDVDKLF